MNMNANRERERERERETGRLSHQNYQVLQRALLPTLQCEGVILLARRICRRVARWICCDSWGWLVKLAKQEQKWLPPKN